MKEAKNIFKFLFLILSTSLYLPPSLGFSQQDWFHCPFVEEIKKKGDSLTATTTTHGVTIEWLGWIQSTNLPTQFTSVFFEGNQPPWFIICHYKDNDGNFALLAPLYGIYKSDGQTSGPWSGRNCEAQDPGVCLFSVIHSPAPPKKDGLA